MLGAIEVLLNIGLAVALAFAVVTWIWEIKSDGSYNSRIANFWADVVLAAIEMCLALVHGLMGQGGVMGINIVLAFAWWMNAIFAIHDMKD